MICSPTGLVIRSMVGVRIDHCILRRHLLLLFKEVPFCQKRLAAEETAYILVICYSWWRFRRKILGSTILSREKLRRLSRDHINSFITETVRLRKKISTVLE